MLYFFFKIEKFVVFWVFVGVISFWLIVYLIIKGFVIVMIFEVV